MNLALSLAGSLLARSRKAPRGALVCFALVGACGRSKDVSRDAAVAEGANDAASVTAASAFVWPLSIDAGHESLVPPRKGMIWIPPGTLFAGTFADRTPRIADEEPAGEAMELTGFYIDEFAYPNEVGAIPKTGMSRDEAAGLCATQEKRLCTELEWERACKGPANTTYEYGESYRATECLTGQSGRLAPSGLRVSCKSPFGVHDMHGGPWEWTASTWRRGPGPHPGIVRGGNGDAGELVARCANAVPTAPTAKRPDLGARCCAGPPNRAEIKLTVVRGKTLEAHRLDATLAAALVTAIGRGAPPELPAQPAFRVDRAWLWHPVGNEELLVAAGCVKQSPHMACGAGVFRMRVKAGEPTATPTLVGFASSGWWMSVVKPDHTGRDLLVFGGDGHSSYKRRASYAWGRISIGEPERSTARDLEDEIADKPHTSPPDPEN